MGVIFLFFRDDSAQVSFRVLGQREGLAGQPWGLRVKGGKVTYDFSSYGGWSSWHHHNWIVAPFERYYAQFPKACR